MQAIAIERIFPLIWPDYAMLQVDTLPSELAKRLDIGGVDTVLYSLGDGHLIHIGQRYRESDVWPNPKHRDFTVRDREWHRHNQALESGGVIPAFYVYGYATESEQDFAKLFVVRYRVWLVDIHNRRARVPYYFDRGRGNCSGVENFYYLPWRQMPEDYLRFVYPQPVAQLTLGIERMAYDRTQP